jgi:hypothetical protein
MFVMAFVFTYRYFTVVGPLFHALMLVFHRGRGASPDGRPLQLFVFFELVSVRVCADGVRHRGGRATHRTLNFAVQQRGAFLILTGIGTVRCRALSMAQIGARWLTDRRTRW